MKLKILDLFSGLGGFSLGLERTGSFETVAFCDNDKYSKLVLQKHWKGVKIYNDVKEITKEKFIADGIQFPDIITGGFPCQPFSVAGKQAGTDDDRHLWPVMFRIIQEFTPRWVIGENVKGLTNIQDGVVFETVCTDLEGAGYEVRTFNIPAAGVGAPHRRERLWIVAHAKRYNKTDEIGRVDETSRRIQEEHRQDDSSARLTSRTSSIRQTNNGHEDMEDSRRTLQQGTELRETNEDEIREGYANQHQRSSSTSEFNVANTERERLERLNQQSTTISGKDERTYTRNESSRDQATGTEDVANTQGERTRENNEGLRSRTSGVSGRQGTSGTEEDVANTYARLSNGTYEEVQSRGQTFDTSSEGNTDVANTESSNRHDNEAVAGNGESSTQEVFGDGSSVSGEGSWWHTEPDVGRVAHGVPGRVYRLKGLGNSIVPKIAEEIGKAIIKAEKE